MKEEWKKVPYDELQHYEVSTLGNVRLLPRDVETHIVNRGRDMIVTAHRKGKDIKVQYDGGRPTIRMLDTEGHRRKFSLPLLMLKTFKPEECPGDNVEEYTAAYLDSDVTHNTIDNLVWVSKSALMSSISNTIKGESHDYLVKYENIIIKVNGQIVGYFANTTDGAELFNSYGITTSSSAISRTLKEGKLFYFMFEFEQVSAYDYINIALNYQQMNLKIIYDIIMEDRKHKGRMIVEKVIKQKPKVERVIKERIVYKPKIIEKIVYRDKPVKEKKSEEVKEKKKVLVNDRTTDVKKTKSKAVKTAEKLKTKLDDIDDAEFYKEQEMLKKQRFMDELKSRLKM